MKKLVFLFLSLLTVGSLFQACDDTKTYAEMLEDEKNAVEKFIKDSAIHVISLEEFERDTITAAKARGDAYDEYVFFPTEGVYMQIINRGDKGEVKKFVDGNNICTRYLELNVATRALTAFNIPLPEYMDYPDLSSMPLTFRYVKAETYSAGIFVENDALWGYGTVVPQGWLLSLPYLRDDAHVRLIIPSKMGHQAAQQEVTPYFYNITRFLKAKS